MTALSSALMTSWPVLPPSSSRASTSAISSGVTNSICSPVVMALNSSSEKMPFSPVSMNTLLRVCPGGGALRLVVRPEGRPGRERLRARGVGVVERHRPPAA